MGCQSELFLASLHKVFPILIFAGLVLNVFSAEVSTIILNSSIIASNNQPYDDTAIAVCMVGHDRTMMYPAVIAAFEESFAHLRFSQTFAVLELDTIHDSQVVFKTRQGRTDFEETPQAWSQHHHKELNRYNLSIEQGNLFFINHNNSFVGEFFKENGECSPPHGSCINTKMKMLGYRYRNEAKVCEHPDVMEEMSHSRENGVNFAEQVWKGYFCGRMIESWEVRYNTKFEWILKTRPDIILLQPFPLHVYSPIRTYFNKKTKDHIFLCPRNQCSGYFVDGPKAELNCSATNFGFDVGGSKVSFMGYQGINKPGYAWFYYSLYRPTGPICEDPITGPPCVQLRESLVLYNEEINDLKERNATHIEILRARISFENETKFIIRSNFNPHS